jgi:hexokinase
LPGRKPLAHANRQDKDEHRDAVWELDRLTAARAAEEEATRLAAIARARGQKANRHPRRLSGAA